MEQHPFSLTSALDSWKRRLRHGRGVTDDDLAKLESHLHDSMAELRRSGLSEEDSFMIASHRLGNVRTLAAELSENKPPPLPEASGGAAQREPHHSPHSEKTTSGFWSFSLKLLGVLLLLAGTGDLIVCGLTQKKYVGRVKMQVHQPKQRPSMPTSSAGSIPLEMEFRIITGAETLRLVVQEKGLTKRWAPGTDENAAMERLSAMVEPTLERGTELISLEVFSPNPAEAAELANAVAAAYQRRRNEYEKSRTLEMLDTLETEAESQKKKVEEKRSAMLEVMKKYEIVDLDGPQGGGQDSARLALELEERINRLKYVRHSQGINSWSNTLCPKA